MRGPACAEVWKTAWRLRRRDLVTQQLHPGREHRGSEIRHSSKSLYTHTHDTHSIRNDQKTETTPTGRPERAAREKGRGAHAGPRMGGLVTLIPVRQHSRTPTVTGCAASGLQGRCRTGNSAERESRVRGARAWGSGGQ